MLTNIAERGKTCDAAELKRLASGRWPDTLVSVAGIPRELLDGRNHPCPKCGGTDRFRFIDPDAGACFCNQCFNNSNGDGLAAVQWSRGCDFPTACRLVADYLGVGGNGRMNGNGSHHSNGHKPQKSAPTNWAIEADRHFNHPDADAKRHELAGTLGVDIEVLEDWQEPAGVVTALGVGWTGDRWTCPERDATGRVIGIATRMPDGTKRFLPGGKRGLVFARDWQNDDGPVVDVEGPSDTAAGLKLGLCCIGRPSANGGADVLADLLRDVPANRQIVIVGENDAKPDGSWPGRDGAVRVAEKLAESLQRPVCWALCPDGAKDIREWSQRPDASGGEFLRRLQLNHVVPSAVDKIEPDEPGGDDDDEPEKSFTFHTAAEFDELDLHRDYHIPGILAAGPVGTVLTGAFKTLKTSVVMDLLISLATQHRFLNRFPVSRRVRTAVMSGESGGNALQNLARRVSQSKGWAFRRIEDWFSICTVVPNLSSSADVDAIERYVVERNIGLLCIDPTYLAMPNVRADDAGSIFAMGKLLRALSRLGERTGCTPLIVHHNTRSSMRMNAGEPAELADIAWSGFAEWAGQWVLLSRREKYNPDSDGEHRLWMTAGGRDGHSTLVGVDVTEGRADSPQGRRWDVDVVDAGKVRAEAMEAAHERKVEQQDARKQKQAEDDCTAIVDAMRRIGEPQTKTAIREQCGIGHRGFNVAFADLLSDETIVPVQIVKGNNRTYDGFQLQQPATARNSPSDAGRCNRSSNGPPPHRGGGSVAPALLPLGGFNDEQETGPVGADADCTDDGDDKWWEV
jgi:phage/plasmid primase-like uncharacterized protein